MLPNVAKPRTKVDKENGTNTAERRMRRKRRSETEVANVVDGTCIRWIAASFRNSRGKLPSCSPT